MNKAYKKYSKRTLRSIENEEIRSRIEYLLDWYNKKATRCKIKYYIFASIGIVGPALITLISSYKCFQESCIVPVISTISAICAGILVLTRWQEGWIRYRSTVELIKSKLSIYIVETKSITDKEKQKKDEEFIKCIEEIVQNENYEWIKVRDQKIKDDE